MNLSTAKTEELEARIAELREARDTIFESEKQPTAESVRLRNLRVEKKLALLRGEDTSAEIAALEAQALLHTSDRDARRSTVKLAIRAAELELARRAKEALKVELSSMSIEELQEYKDAHVAQAREHLVAAKAASAVLNDRLATKKFLDLAKDLSPADREKLVEQLRAADKKPGE